MAARVIRWKIRERGLFCFASTAYEATRSFAYEIRRQLAMLLDRLIFSPPPFSSLLHVGATGIFYSEIVE